MTDEKCLYCKYFVRLKHNFKLDHGFEESYCCHIFANEKDGFVIEVEENSMCECFDKNTHIERG